jgi:A/G-specific adenine glycosylase
MGLAQLIKWSQTEFPSLPWRKNRSLYRTLVSEIMLQQTTVGTVKNHYDRFLLQFPDLQSLASASEHEMLVAWKGLGYYRRARNLKKIAEKLVSDYDGVFPKEREVLQEIPGIGPYTANALLSIGMDRPALSLDANLERVISRYIGIALPKGPKLHKEIQRQFEEGKIFNDKKMSFRALNEALMDLGRTYCQARKATCELCPLNKECFAFNKARPLDFPLEDKTKVKAEEHELHLLRVFVKKKDKILVYKKEDSEWLSGQYEVPTFIIHSTDKKLNQYPLYEGKLPKNLPSYKSGITKYKITNFVMEMSESEVKKLTMKKLIWVTTDASSNLSTATTKGLRAISDL